MRELPEVYDPVLIHPIKRVKPLKGFLLMGLPSKVMVVLLNFRHISRYLPEKLNYGIST
jgi:hypothetical protein